MVKYLVALRDPETGPAALRSARALAREGDEIVAMHVFEPHEVPWGNPTAEVVVETERLMDAREQDIADSAEAIGLDVDVVVDVPDSGESTAHRIAREAEARDVDVVIVVSKRASGVLGLLLGSVAQGLLEVCPCPVLVVRPPE